MHPLILTQDTEVSFLAANDPVFSSLVSDDYKAYIRFKICTAFPNVIGPEQHGRYFGFAPGVLAASHQSLLHQQTNLGHALKAYGAYRDRIIGGIVGVAVGNLPPGHRAQSGPLPIPETIDQAPYLDCVASIYKLAEGVKDLLGNHASSRQKTSVSIEAGTNVEDLWVYDPRDRSIHSMEAAAANWPGLLTADQKRHPDRPGGRCAVRLRGRRHGRQDPAARRRLHSHPGRGPDRQNPRTQRLPVRRRLPRRHRHPRLAARRRSELEPVFAGMDAGRGKVIEVIREGAHVRHGMTKRASAADPLLGIKVHGKRLAVLRHASSVSKT